MRISATPVGARRRASLAGRAVLTAAIATALAACAAPLGAQAASDPFERHAGRFVRDSAASDDVADAIERAVARMGFITRPIGRSRLRATNQPPAEVRLAFPADSVVILYEGQPEVRAGRTGAARPWRNAAGEEFALRVTVTAAPDGSMAIVQVFEAEDGRRENRWQLAADGTVLRLDVVVTSPRLPEPLRYRQVFRRGTR